MLVSVKGMTQYVSRSGSRPSVIRCGRWASKSRVQIFLEPTGGGPSSADDGFSSCALAKEDASDRAIDASSAPTPRRRDKRRTSFPSLHFGEEPRAPLKPRSEGWAWYPEGL